MVEPVAPRCCRSQPFAPARGRLAEPRRPLARTSSSTYPRGPCAGSHVGGEEHLARRQPATAPGRLSRPLPVVPRPGCPTARSTATCSPAPLRHGVRRAAGRAGHPTGGDLQLVPVPLLPERRGVEGRPPGGGDRHDRPRARAGPPPPDGHRSGPAAGRGALRVLRGRHRRAARPRRRRRRPPAAVRVPALLPAVRAPRARAAGGTAASARRYAASTTCVSTTPRGTPCGSPSTWCSSSARRGADAACCAFYPGPGGATESELDLPAWARHRRGQPGRSTRLEADVEAVLLRRHDGDVHLLPGADRRLLRAGRRRAHRRGRVSAAARRSGTGS